MNLWKNDAYCVLRVERVAADLLSPARKDFSFCFDSPAGTV
jgi:hypothetical protein